MLLTYFDDSGEQGVFLLAGVIVDEADWLNLLDAWTDYRRWLRDNFGLRMSRGTNNRVPVELHGTDIATGSGEWRKLKVGREARLRAFRTGLKLIGRHANVFTVAWMPDRPMTDDQKAFHINPAVDCWKVCLERLATYSIKSANAQRVLTSMDTGYEGQFRKEVRRMRRYHRVGSQLGGSLDATAPMLIDDPIMRESRHHPFTQMADMCAYAALRELRPTKRVSDLWPYLDQGIVRAVNKYVKDAQPPGIKLLPP